MSVLTRKRNEILKSPDELKAQQKAQMEARIRAEVEAQYETQFETDRASVQSDGRLQERVEAAQAEGRRAAKTESYDRSTVIAFGLLFVLPAVIIVFAILFFLPFIARSIQQEPSGATTLPSNSGGMTRSNR